MKYEITSKRLRDAMAIRGISQQQLADSSQIGKSSISHYVNGTNEPGNKSAYKMAKVLNVNPAWLMGFDVPMESIETVQKNMVTARLDWLATSENDEKKLVQLENDFKEEKEKYELIKSVNKFVELYENATPEARTLVENFLKSSQQ